ncbi:MAG: zinc-ribbon domain-containing protein [Candidatus Marinimicrobia bacterium]|jgi:uncharacterized membrane protein YvbJ|nr:zinc-ribbon domain-containing protein [Candidatus Neomarinimicrobiota bacterium]MBT5069039.1 zinc-ribbon domain-containing protein [Candidatus Neomarinimicrobiota bacterium]
MAFCSKCGKEISANASFCDSCGTDLKNETQVSTNTRNVENHLTKAILVTVFCCLPFGIVSIVNASSVNGKIQAGDIDGAIEASKKADQWANWGIFAGLGFGIIYFLIIVATGF